MFHKFSNFTPPPQKTESLSCISEVTDRETIFEVDGQPEMLLPDLLDFGLWVNHIKIQY